MSSRSMTDDAGVWRSPIRRRPVSLRDMIDAPFSRRVTGKPADFGIDESALAELVARAQREIDEGHIPSCQIAFARDGELVVWLTLGAAAEESRYVIFSSTKPVVASAMWILMGEGAIDVSRAGSRAGARVRGQREGSDHHRTGDAAHVGVPARARSPRPIGTIRIGAGSASGSGSATGSPERASSTTRLRRTGCWPS